MKNFKKRAKKPLKNKILTALSLGFATIGFCIFSYVKGVSFITIASIALILSSLILAIIFYNETGKEKNKPLADYLGLKITKSLSLAGFSGLDMRGKINDFEVFFRRKTYITKMKRSRKYIFAIRISNPANINLYIKPKGFLTRPFRAMPPKLYTAKWDWPDFIEIYGKPFKAIETLLKDTSSSRTFHHFFAKITCKIKGKDMEFYTEELQKSNSLQDDQIKTLFDLGAKIALKIDKLSPSLK